MALFQRTFTPEEPKETEPAAAEPEKPQEQTPAPEPVEETKGADEGGPSTTEAE